jgi:hypothetical protein
MKVGEKVIVSRTPSGLYRIECEGKPTIIGCAASTAISLVHTVFWDEAIASSLSNVDRATEQ